MARSTAAPTHAWRTIAPAPVVMLYGSEEYFTQKAKEKIRADFRAAHDDVEIISLSASTYTSGQLIAETSPSLFGGAKIVEVDGLASMNDDFLPDALNYLASPDPESVVVFSHAGGNKGKKLLDTFKKSPFPFIETKPLKSDKDKQDFVFFTVKSAGRQIAPEAVRTLVAAAGSDVAELASACRQLIDDSAGAITLELVEKYYGDRVEVTAFKVADAAVSAQPALALKLLRNALDSGAEPIPLVGALALKMRNIAKVHGSSGRVEGMAPWQAQQAQRDSRRFSAADLAHIFSVLADADAALKGEAADSLYPLEKAVLAIARAGRS
ncbi:DNA polymerase III subunit delta [Rothia sp. ZJ932]|uniref:DNA polymerase III subunit delta n=1 Tax=Rothia sp. ZJ932 TaxID=2810516 RepID=UPI001F0785E9|nr:DNA polymerase III subunit delta [Rothia sp. ZJ932]